MLQITEYNICLKFGPKIARAFNCHWQGMGVRMRAKTVIRHPICKLELWTKIFQQTWSQELNSDEIDLILALAVYLPVWHPQCKITSFTVLVSCIDGFAVHSCPLLNLPVCRGKLRNLRADCSTVWLYCVTITW